MEWPAEIPVSKANAFLKSLKGLSDPTAIPDQIDFSDADYYLPVLRQTPQGTPRKYLPSIGSTTAPINNVNLGTPTDKESVKNLVKQQSDAAFGSGSWPAMQALLTKESGFNPAAQNPTSSAYGLFQMLDSTWKGYSDVGKTADPAKQTEAGIKYIKKRYGDPNKALQFHKQKGWY